MCSVWAVLQRGTVHLPATAASAAQEDKIFLAHKEKILLPGVAGGVEGETFGHPSEKSKLFSLSWGHSAGAGSPRDGLAMV